MPTPASSVTDLLLDLQHGREGALDALMPVVYEALRGMAANFLYAEREGHTLQPTALVHEAYLRLVDQRTASYASRLHFYAVASTIMRRIIVDHARRRNSEKRGGGRVIALQSGMDAAIEQSDDVIHVDEALARLAQLNARQARVVELRFFGGLSVEDTAAVLDVSDRTVKRDWAMASAWLHRELKEQD